MAMKVMMMLERISPRAMVMAVEVFLFHVEVLFYPLHLTQSSDVVVKDAAQHIASRAVDHQYPRVEAGGHQCDDDRLAGKREETASQEGCQKHPPITVLGQEVNDEVHRLKTVSKKTVIRMT